MKQLSWTDDMMLRAKRPDTPMQIQMLLTCRRKPLMKTSAAMMPVSTGLKSRCLSGLSSYSHLSRTMPTATGRAYRRPRKNLVTL